eukprot:scaffold15217_cov31-Prasinocladus_malaysianus.AAC.1
MLRGDTRTNLLAFFLDVFDNLAPFALVAELLDLEQIFQQQVAGDGRGGGSRNRGSGCCGCGWGGLGESGQAWGEGGLHPDGLGRGHVAAGRLDVALGPADVDTPATQLNLTAKTAQKHQIPPKPHLHDKNYS